MRQVKQGTMPLNPGMMHTAVRVIGDLADPGTIIGQRRGAIGTGFLASVPSATIENLRYPYVITAHHVIEDQNHI
jgi:hypothetical protein